MRWQNLEIPDNCLVRLMDMDISVRGVTVMDEAGFLNIYINARLSRDGQREALKHELRHCARGDMYSDADIRTVEAAAERASLPVLVAMDGTPLDAEVPPGLRPAGRGVYLPVGGALERALEDLRRVEALLHRALRWLDVMQAQPGIPVSRLEPLASGLCAEDIAFVGFPPLKPLTAASSVLHFCREPGDRLRGAIFYDGQGRPDNALVIMEAGEARVTVDLRRRHGQLDVWSIGRDTGGGYEKVWGE